MARRFRIPAESWRPALARVALAWERVWPAFWPVAGLLLGFVAVACFDLLPSLPRWLHLALLAVFLVILLATGLSGYRRFRWPERHEAQRRIERDSGLAHRPLAALDDRLAAEPSDTVSSTLWAIHRRRMAEASARLRLAWPRAGLVTADPYGSRAALILLLVIGLMDAGGDFWSRLGRAIVPPSDRSAVATSVGLDLWITPPSYTGLPPIYRGAGNPDRVLQVPAGSTVLAQVNGGDRTPRLAIDDAASDFTVAGAGNYSATAKLGDAHRLAITQGGSTLARYDIHIVPDHPPSVAWNGPVKAMPQGALRLDYKASDDFGIKSIMLEITLPDDDTGKAISVPLQLSSHGKEVSAVSYQDLTASPWAGLPVELRLVARDGLDQPGTSAVMKATLPERVFHNPVAQAVIEQRKALIRHPTRIVPVQNALSDLSMQPDLFGGDSTVFLGLRTAFDRLGLDPDGTPDNVQLLLWDIALRIEDGDTPAAQGSLRQAEQALQEALDRNASSAEIDKLTHDLQEAIQRYLQSMMANAARNGQNQMQGNGNATVTPQDIAKMLAQAHDMAQTGARDAAKAALSRLQDLLESLRAGGGAQRDGGAAGQAMHAMQELERQQQQLMDRTYRQAQRGREGGPRTTGQQGIPGQMGNPGELRDLAAAQDALRHALLDELAHQMGGNGTVPQAFERAERMMEGATSALQQGQPEAAIGPQGQALDQLQQAMKALSEQPGQGGEPGQPDQAGRDPFGRNSTSEGDGVKLPSGENIQRSRKILDELRRRSGDYSRPPAERDYIDRLLKSF